MSNKLDWPEHLIEFKEEDCLTLKESQSGMLFCGRVGAGKTSGSGIRKTETKASDRSTHNESEVIHHDR